MQQNNELLTHLIQHTSAPIVIYQTDGTIVWVNDAFEELLGWSKPEICYKITWINIASDNDEIMADAEMLTDLARDERTFYKIQKTLKTKNGPQKRVVAHVIKYPISGKLDYCLATIMPLDMHLEYIAGQITVIQQMLKKRDDLGININRTFRIIEDYPKAVAVILLIISVVFFGDQVLKVLHAVSTML